MFIAVLLLVLVCSVVFNVIQYQDKQVLGSDLLNNGLEQTFVYLNGQELKNRSQAGLHDYVHRTAWAYYTLGQIVARRKPYLWQWLSDYVI